MEVQNLENLDYCGIADEYLDGCDKDEPLYDYKGDKIVDDKQNNTFARRIFMPTQVR